MPVTDSPLGGHMDDHALATALVLLHDLEEDGGVRRSAATMRLRETCLAAVAHRLDADPDAVGRFLCRLVRDAYLSDEAIEGGAGVEDVCQFWHWFDQRMWPDRRPRPGVDSAVTRAQPGPPPVASGVTAQLARR